MSPGVSVVIPVYNEEAVLPALFARLYPALDALNVSYEIIFVNDGSRDASPALLRELIAVVSEAVTRRHPHFCTMMLREILAGSADLEPVLVAQPARILAAVQRIVARGVREGEFRPVDPVLTHLSLVGSLVFFFATKRFRERVLARRRPAVRPPDAAAYVKHMQDLLTHGLAAPDPGGTRRPSRRRR